jgi:hypothetical protein
MSVRLTPPARALVSKVEEFSAGVRAGWKMVAKRQRAVQAAQQKAETLEEELVSWREGEEALLTAKGNEIYALWLEYAESRDPGEERSETTKLQEFFSDLDVGVDLDDDSIPRPSAARLLKLLAVLDKRGHRAGKRKARKPLGRRKKAK